VRQGDNLSDDLIGNPRGLLYSHFMLPDAPTGASRRPACSIGAIACMAVIVATVAFLATPEGQAFNERVFGRFYTAGMILAFGVYGLGGLAVFVGGVVLAVLAWRRREEPRWLRRLAVLINIVAPIVAFVLYSYL
jgi:hypothetical protein